MEREHMLLIVVGVAIVSIILGILIWYFFPRLKTSMSSFKSNDNANSNSNDAGAGKKTDAAAANPTTNQASGGGS